jgi:hypothetical protein
MRAATSVVEDLETQIRAIADMLARQRRIHRWQRSVKKILARVPREHPCLRTLFGSSPLSTAGRVLIGKIMGAFSHLEFLGLPAFEELVEAGP